MRDSWDRIHVFRVLQSIAESVGLPTDKRHPYVLEHSLAPPPSRWLLYKGDERSAGI
jgi:hypothetical protein